MPGETVTVAPLRFGVMASQATSRQDWITKVRRIERLGYGSLLLPDHFDGQLGPIAALGTAAAVTDSIRLGSLVFNADVRHPALLAKEVATLDLLSDGRFEVGLGAGWDRGEYEEAGIPFVAGSVRVDRLTEFVRAMKGLLHSPRFDHDGTHFPIGGLENRPRTVQERVPVMIGGGGPRLLRLAAAEADIIGVTPRFGADGRMITASLTAAATRDRVGWLRRDLGARMPSVEFSLFLEAVAVTADRQGAAAEIGGRLGLAPEAVLDSPYVLIGTPTEIAATVRARQAEFGFGYVVVFERFMDEFAEVVALLSG